MPVNEGLGLMVKGGRQPVGVGFVMRELGGDEVIDLSKMVRYTLTLTQDTYVPLL